MNFVKNGVLRLPPGFRFHPTDEELVLQYLKRKVFSFPLPSFIIPDFDVCKSDPWDLPGDLEEERYYFSTKEVKYPNGSRTNRATTSGYWKATGLDKQIVVTTKNHHQQQPQPQVVGMKKTLVFYMGKPPNGTRTDWIMHEYRLANVQTFAPLPHNLSKENWVLCRIFLKKRSSNGTNNSNSSRICRVEEKCESNIETGKVVFYDFLGKEDKKTLSSSSGSSGITEISSSVESNENPEESSSFNSLSVVAPFKRK